MAALPTSALADWPYYRDVTSGTSGYFPIGGAIRNWGPTDEVYVAAETHHPSGAGDTLALHYYTCSDNDTCATATQYATTAVGSALLYDNAMHPSLGIRRTSGLNVVKILARQKLQNATRTP